SATGLGTGAAAGSATITATSEGQAGSAAVTVNLVPVASVSVSPVSASVTVGQTVQLTATPRDANGIPLSGRLITWVSSAPAVAAVSTGGLVTGVATGTVTITATSEGKSGKAAVTVTTVPAGPVASVTLSPATASIVVGGTQQFVVTLKDASGTVLTGQPVSWMSSNFAVAMMGTTPG